MVANEVTFTMLVGISGSGKSTYAKELMDKYKKEKAKAVLLSSDTIRKELYGDESIQKNPPKVFQLMERRTLDMARKGFHVIYDATNLSSRRRKHIVMQVKKLGCFTRCVIVVANRELCIERQSLRERTVPTEVIDRQIRSFEIPTEMEGWDDIDFTLKDTKYYKTFVDYLEETRISHDCKFHSLSIYDHLDTCYYIAKSKLKAEKERDYIFFRAALLHDIGKPFTKSFVDSKDILGTEAHYYGHECAGAWFILCSRPSFVTKEDCLMCARLVGLHMKMYLEVWYKRISDFYSERDPVFWMYLKLLHECDVEAH